jgi:ATP-dependent RNA helicase DHX36
MGPNVSLKPAKIAEIRASLTLDAQHKNSLIYEDDSDDEPSKFRSDFLRIIASDLESNIKNAMQRTAGIPIDTDDDLNERLRDDLQQKQDLPAYCRMLEFRQKLPAFEKQDNILQMIAAHQIILIKGETGCGKTTQVAQFILDDAIRSGRGAGCKIICTQPRRIAAITIAERVASERNESLGESAGYQIRLDNVLPRSKASILYCTTGIVLKLMETDPILQDYSHIILDEIHERDLNSDTIISLLKLIVGWRKDLKIVLMSATLRAEYFSEYFFNCPMLEIDGFTYKVEEKYLEDVLETTQNFDFQAKSGGRRDESHKYATFSRNFKSQERAGAEYVEMMMPYRNSLKGQYSKAVLDAIMRPESEEVNVELIESLILHISRECPPGAILVFLPGYEKISKLYNNLTKSGQFPAQKFVVHPLHSMLPSAAQKSVFERPPEGVRKIIIATNIAETSITIGKYQKLGSPS